MLEVVYTSAYWRRALKLIDTFPHKCEYCHSAHNLQKGDRYCFVRVIDIGEVPGESANLVLACRKCRANPRGPHLSRKQLLDKIAELPFPASEPEKAPHA